MQEVELVRRGYEAVARGGFRAVLDLLDPNIEVRTAEQLPEAGTYRGHEQVARLMETLTEPFEEWTLEPEEFIPAGENVVVPLHNRGQGRESGIEVDAHIVHVWTIRNDRAVKLHVYVDRAEALKAVGLQA